MATDGIRVEIFTDGACKGNPGPGGWGVLLRYKDNEKTLSGAEAHTTNNRMELMAAIKGLEALRKHCEVHLYTDSRYVQNGMLSWIKDWKRNGWKNSQKKPVQNADLWKLLDQYAALHTVHWHWVKGHSNHPENDRVDALANEAIQSSLSSGNKNATDCT